MTSTDETVKEVVRSVVSFVDTGSLKQEISRVFLNKRKRASTVNEYIDSLLRNASFYKIKNENIINIIRMYVSKGGLPDKDAFIHHYNYINDKVGEISHDQLLSHARSCFDKNRKIKNEDAEYEYCYCCCYDMLLANCIKYIYEPECTHIIYYINDQHHDFIAQSFESEIYQHTLVLSNKMC